MIRRMVCVVTVALATLTACSGGAEPTGPSSVKSSSAPSAVVAQPSSAQPPPAVTRPPVVKPWVDLTVGECVADVPAVDVGESTVSVVDCAAPHRAEVYLLAPVAVDAALADVGDRACAAGVDAYTGGRRDLAVTYLIDSKQDRTGAIRLPSTVICMLQSATGAPLTASVARG